MKISDPKIWPATMQELSIKKELAKDLKKTVKFTSEKTKEFIFVVFQSLQDIRLLDYHFIFWEEPQMNGRKLRKEGHLFVKLLERSSSKFLLSAAAAALNADSSPFESWRNAYVTLRLI